MTRTALLQAGCLCGWKTMKLKHSPVPGLGQSEGWQHVFFGHARGSVYQDWGRHCAAGSARVRPCIVIIADSDGSQPSQAWPGRDHRPAECPSSTLPMRRLRCVSVLCSSRPNLGSSQLYNCWAVRLRGYNCPSRGATGRSKNTIRAPHSPEAIRPFGPHRHVL